MDSLDSRFCCPAGRLEPVRELLFFCGRSVCSFSAYRIHCLTWLDVLEVEVKDGMVLTEPRFESRTCKCQFRWTKLDKFIPREHCARCDLITCLPFTVPTTYLQYSIHTSSWLEKQGSLFRQIFQYQATQGTEYCKRRLVLLIARRRSPPNIAQGRRQQQDAGVALESFSSDSRLLQCSADADAGSVACLSDWLVLPWAWHRRLQLVQSLAWPQAPTTLFHTTRTAHLCQGRAWLCMRSTIVK